MNRWMALQTRVIGVSSDEAAAEEEEEEVCREDVLCSLVV
jgi:hypothetical protein